MLVSLSPSSFDVDGLIHPFVPIRNQAIVVVSLSSIKLIDMYVTE